MIADDPFWSNDALWRQLAVEESLLGRGRALAKRHRIAARLAEIRAGTTMTTITWCGGCGDVIEATPSRRWPCGNCEGR